MNASDLSAKADEAGRKADDSDVLDHAVRVGLIAYGVVHLLIAWVAIQLAFGDRSGSASSEGALSQLGQSPFGGVLLVVVAGGFFSLVVWQLIEAAVGHREKDGKSRALKRVGSGIRAVLYGTLGVSALTNATGSSGGGGTDGTTAKLMSLPGGQLLVGLVGVGLLGYAVRQVWRGLDGGFKKRLQTEGHTGYDGKAFVTFGRVGYVSKGLALAVVSILFFWAAVSHDPKKSGGLDQALHKVLQQPFGAPILVAIGVGIACYGLFCFAWARHLDR